MPSAAGLALQRLPAMVPAFWICMPPIWRAAAFRGANCGGSGVAMRADQVVAAGMCQCVASRVMGPARAVMSMMSMMSMSGGVAARAG